MHKVPYITQDDAGLGVTILSIFCCLMLMLPLIRRSRQETKVWIRVKLVSS